MGNYLTSTLMEDLAEAYVFLTEDFMSIGRTCEGYPSLPDLDGDLRDLLRLAASRCGARIAAAVKREKRCFLLKTLMSVRDEGMDITPAVAQGAARRVLGRGLDGRVTARLFSTPGRTAKSKSRIGAIDLACMENALKEKLTELLDKIEAAKVAAWEQWLRSSERFGILSDWALQRQLRTGTKAHA